MKTNFYYHLIVALFLLLSINSFAEKYFFTPGGTGLKDGSSWANAAEGELLGVSLPSFSTGDEVYLTEGTYYPDMDMYRWQIPQGLIIKGGFPLGQTDASTEITYPTNHETIFTADYDGDGTGDNGSAGFIQIINPNADGEDTKDNFNKITISGITITKSHYTGSNYGGGALFIKHANVELNWVKFINNSSSARGGAGLTAWGSYVTCRDCIFKDNYIPDNSGAAWLIRQYKSGTTSSQTNRSVAIFERCEFTDNTSSAGSSSAYGGGASMADYAGKLYLINCTWSGSTGLRSGGAVRISSGVEFYCINSTFFNNYTNNGDKAGAGDAISAGSKSTNYFANTIFVNTIDEFNPNKALLFFQDGTTKAYSEGYNVWGTISDAGENTFHSTDKLTTAENIYTKSVVFGTSELSNNGGWSKTITPTMDVSGMQVSALETLMTTWNLPEGIDLTVDQRGYKRAATSMSGAMDSNGTAPEPPAALETIGSKNDIAIANQGNGIYSISGAEGIANVFDINGKSILKNIKVNNGSLIDMSATAKGIYIVNVNGRAVKIVR